MMRWRVMLVAVSVVGLVAVGCSDDSDDASDETTTTTADTSEESSTTSTADTTTTTDTTTSQPDDAASDEVPLSGGEVELTLDPAVVPAVPGPVEVAVDGTVPQGYPDQVVMVCPEWEGPDASAAGPRSCGFDETAQELAAQGLLANVTVSDFGFSTTLTVDVDQDLIDKGGVTILAGDIMVPVGGWTTLQIGDPTDDESTAAAPVDEYARLSGLPWAGPDDAHEDPIQAVEAFVGFVGDTHMGDPSAPAVEVVIGGFAAGDQRSGEVEVTFAEPASTGSGTVDATITVFVRQSGPDDTWWVLGSASSTLVIDEPQPDAVIESPVLIAGENSVISDAVEFRLYANGDDTPLVETFVTGGGIFATGAFMTDLGAPDCLTFRDEPCDVIGPAGEPGTMMFTTSWAVTTVPVTFADT